MKDKRGDAYREEAAELLATLESSLLELEAKPQDQELVDSVFRALHTLKGSGAMFGFEAVAGFTHKLETAFDQVREGAAVVTGELIGVTLAARDHIHRLLEPDVNPADLEADGAAILGRLGAATRTEDAPAASAAPEAAPAAPHGEPCEWRITFEPAPELLQGGANPLLLLDELRQLGDFAVGADVTRIPPLAELDPTECHVHWNGVLTTTAGENAIRDVFIFVEDRCHVAIEKLEPPPVTAPRRGGARTAEERRRCGADAASLRVPAAKLDQLVDIVGELVTVQARLSGYAQGREDTELSGISEAVERLTERLRENTMNIRMLPIGETFLRFKRLVRDVSADLGKKVDFFTEGNETELDKTVIEQLSDPLVHLVRNAVDHGIELPQERVAVGKPEAGRITLSATHAGAFVLIRIEDDGRGLDRAAIRERAVERGLIAPDQSLTDSELDSLIFMPGFSTASKVTALSGRGVGMDVVQRNLDALRGVVSVTSTPGHGTTVTLRIPLTLAIIEGLLVEAGGAFFVVPLSNVCECIELVRAPGRAGRQHLVTVRDQPVPYIVLRERFSLPGRPPVIEQVIVAETNDGRFGFVVDRVIGDHHAVIKKLGSLYRHVDEVSGATILGNGSVALVLDVARMAAAVVRERR